LYALSGARTAVVDRVSPAFHQPRSSSKRGRLDIPYLGRSGSPSASPVRSTGATQFIDLRLSGLCSSAPYSSPLASPGGRKTRSVTSLVTPRNVTGSPMSWVVRGSSVERAALYALFFSFVLRAVLSDRSFRSKVEDVPTKTRITTISMTASTIRLPVSVNQMYYQDELTRS
jgi:hypothetical protein